jgi:hypothetical protein
MAISLTDHFKEFLRLLNAHAVEYLIVGGFAVIHHGRSRTTGDLDIWVRPTVENGQRCLAALCDFGFSDCGVKAEEFLDPRAVFRIGVPPWRLELLTTVSGLEFDAAYARRAHADFDGVPADVIGLDDLRANKRASGRLKDLADLEELPEAKP